MQLSELEFFNECKHKTIKEAIDYFEGSSGYKKNSLEYCIKQSLGRIVKDYIQNSSDEEKNKVLNSSFLSFLLGSLPVIDDVSGQKISFIKTQYLNLKFPKTIERKEVDYYSNIPYIDDQDSLHANILKLQKNYSFSNIDKKSLTLKSWGNTPLILACKTGNSGAALELLKAHKSLNLSPNDVDENEMTPLHWACFFRDEELIELLISSGSDIYSKNKNNQTPFDLYNMEIPYNVLLLNIGQASGPSICKLHNIPTIAENRINISHNELKNMIDITFHMDKIAFHRLGITQSQLESTLQEPLYRKHQPNSAFEIFVFHYFYDFIQARNKIGASKKIIELLNEEHAVENKAPQLLAGESEQNCNNQLSLILMDAWDSLEDDFKSYVSIQSRDIRVEYFAHATTSEYWRMMGGPERLQLHADYLNQLPPKNPYSSPVRLLGLFTHSDWRSLDIDFKRYVSITTEVVRRELLNDISTDVYWGMMGSPEQKNLMKEYLEQNLESLSRKSHLNPRALYSIVSLSS